MPPISSAVAMRRGQAIDRLAATIQAISEKYGIDPVPTGVHAVRPGTNPHIAQVKQIEAFDAWTVALAEKLGVDLPEPEPEPAPPVPFDGMGIEALKALSRDKGLPFNETTDENELRTALLRSIGWTAPVVAEPVEVDTDDTERDLEMLTVPQLRDLATLWGIDLTGITLKADIIAALNDREEAQD
jgi:hypothetical protein